MSTPTALHLLIIDDSQNDAESFNKAILAGGQATRPMYPRDKDQLENYLQSHNPDIILFSFQNKITPLDALKKMLKSNNSNAPIILLSNLDMDISIAKAMQAGFRDRVLKKDLDHLKLVVQREYENLQTVAKIEKLKHAYDESEKRCQGLIDNAHDAIAYVHEGMHVYANRSYLNMFGFDSFDDIEGLPVMDLVASEHQEKFKNFLRNVSDSEISTDKTQSLETKLKHTDNSSFVGRMEFGIARIDGETCTELTIRQDVDTKVLEEQISKLVKLDGLTGLLNRQAFIEEFNTKISEMSKTEKNYALLNLGLDNYKKIQDSAGLVGADQIIKDVATQLKDSVRKTDLVTRYEGSSYLVLTDISDETKLTAFAQKILTAINEHIYTVNGRTINVVSSFGISIIDDDTLDVNESISRSIKSLQIAHENGGNKIEIYRPKEGEMTQKQLDADWIKRIKSAFTENRFRLLYQPIVQLDDSSIERYEVFVEMRDEKGERVPPGEFLPAAERTQTSKDIDRWVISNAFAQLVKHRRAKHNTHFFIKLTGGSLDDAQLFRWISEQVKKFELPNNCIVFEVKESAVITHLRQAQAFATLLKTIHCLFAIDDFGHGTEPFKLLQHIPAQYLKFTKNYTVDLATNQQNQATLKEICEKAQELKKRTIVQQVEDAAALTVLYTIGADFMQGNFFQGPSDKMNYNFSSGNDTVA